MTTTIQVNGGTIGALYVLGLDPDEDVILVDTSGLPGVWSVASYPSDLTTPPSMTNPAELTGTFPAQSRPGTTYTIKRGARNGLPDQWVALHFPNAAGVALPSPGFNLKGADPKFQEDSFAGQGDTDVLLNAYLRSTNAAAMAAAGSGVSASTYGALVSALATNDTVSLGATIDVPVDATIGAAGKLIRFPRGFMLRPASGKQIVLATQHDAQDDQQIFDLSAGGSVFFDPTTGPRSTTPEHFGAKRDGTTDDRAAIQAAHDALYTAGQGGDLKFLRGRYALAAGLVFTLGVNIRTAGSGANGIGGTVLKPKASMRVISWSATGAPQKRTLVEALSIIFTSIENTIDSDGKNSSMAFDFSNLNWGIVNDPLIVFEGTSTHGGTGLYFGGQQSPPGPVNGPYWNMIRGVLYFGIQDANCLPAHLTYDTGATNGNYIQFQSISTAFCAVKFGAAVENWVDINDCEGLDDNSAYLIFGDNGSLPSGTLGNHVRMNYYETDSPFTTYLVRFGAVTTSNDRNIVEAVQNDNIAALIDPAGTSLVEGTNSIVIGGREFDKIKLRGGTAYKQTLTHASTADHTSTLPNVSATLAARDPDVHIVSTTGGTTTLATMADLPENVIRVNGSLSSDATIVVPAQPGLEFTIDNGCTLNGHKVQVKAGSGAAQTVYAVTAFFVAHDGTTLIRKQIDTSDNGAGTTYLVAGVAMNLAADTISLFKSDGTTQAGSIVNTSGFVTVNAAGLNLIGTGAGQLGLLYREIVIANDSFQAGGIIKATGTGTVEHTATTSITAKINGTQALKLDTTGIGFYNHATAAQQSITGALSTVTDAAAKAVLTSIIAAGVATGLWTDGTT